MKARVISTGYVVDVELSHYVGNVAWYITKCHASYPEDELEFIDEPQDYWTRLEHQAAIAAMGGMCGNTKYNDYAFVDMAELAIKAAHALVEKYKKEEKK